MGALTPKLHIEVLFEGAPHVVIMSQMIALPGTQIGPAVGDVFAWRDDIVAAVDLLVTGF